jgi:ribosomal protein L17
MDEFEKILMSEKEEDSQRFLTANKEILLSTFRKKVCIPKFRFGNEFVSDFVLFDYYSSLGHIVSLIEIEPPTVRAFTKNGKYAKRLNDAIGQINDWFAWISENEDYFLRTLTSAIDALLKVHGDSLLEHELARHFMRERKKVFIDAKIILGRRAFLSEDDNKRRAAIYQSTNRTIEITHYDRLLDTYQKAAETNRAWSDSASVGELTSLSKSRFSDVRRLVAENVNTHEAILEILADDPEPAVVQAVIENKNTSYSLLLKLAGRNDDNLSKTIVQRPVVPSNLLSILFEESSESLGRLILEHPNCPEEVLISASHSTNRGYRRRAAQHPNLRDQSVLSKLGNDSEAFVRTGAAMNPNLPTNMMLKLSNDPDLKVRIAAVYENKNTSEDDLIKALEHEGSWARSVIAKHSNLKNVDILIQLSRDESWWVREALASNKNLTPSIRETLLADIDERVSRAAGIHKNQG